MAGKKESVPSMCTQRRWDWKLCGPNQTAKDVANAGFLCGQEEETGLVSIQNSLCHSHSTSYFGGTKRKRPNDYS